MSDNITATKKVVDDTEVSTENSEFFKRNVENRWVSVEVTAEEIKRLKKETNAKNVKTLLALKKKYGKDTDYNFSEAEILALFSNLAQHYRYHTDNFVDSQLDKQKSSKHK